jgi:D-threo-aldose 1-dehydrogenase
MNLLKIFPRSTPTSHLGYGTTSLMAVQSSRERLHLLECAYDSGIRHFDTAPYYGYGEAERLLGEFLREKRDQVTVTTKFGIQPSAVVRNRLVNQIARKILGLAPSLRSMLSKKAQSLSKSGAFSAKDARTSLEQSLKSLGTDHVDLFLLHEPMLNDAESKEILDFLEGEVRRGTILAYGCGGEFPMIGEIAQKGLQTSRWLQFEDNILAPRLEEIRSQGARCITYRPFLKALPIISAWLDANLSIRSEWENRWAIKLSGNGCLPSLLLALSLWRNQDGIVLFSSSRCERIKDAAKTAEGTAFSNDQLVAFGDLIALARKEFYCSATRGAVFQ